MLQVLPGMGVYTITREAPEPGVVALIIERSHTIMSPEASNLMSLTGLVRPTPLSAKAGGVTSRRSLAGMKSPVASRPTERTTLNAELLLSPMLPPPVL